MEKNKLVKILFAGITTVLVACGNGEGESDNGAAEGEVVELSFLTRGNPQEIDAYQRAIDIFNEEHDDITVSMDTVPGDNFSEILTTRLQGGQAPDLFYVEDYVASNMIRNESLLSLTDYLNSDETYVNIDDFPEDIWGPIQQGDDIYGLVPDANPIVVFYNKDVFESAGLDTPQEYLDRGEWTWETFEYITQEISAGGNYGYVIGSGAFALNPWIFNNHGDVEEDGEVVLSSNENTRGAFEFINGLVQDGNAVYGGTLPQGQGQEAMFMSGQVGMMTIGRWVVSMLEEGGANYDIVPMPTQGGEEVATTMVTNLFLGVNADTPHPDAAAKFASFYVSEIGQETRLSAGGNSVPSIQGMEEIILEDPVPEHAQYFLDGIENGRPIVYEFTVPGLPQELESIYESMYIGEITVDEALDQAQEMAEQMGIEAGVIEE